MCGAVASGTHLGPDYYSRITPTEFPLLSEIGMHDNRCFIDSGCSTSIISVKSILRNCSNMRKFLQQVPIAGLTGELGIRYSADIHIPVLDT